MVNDSVENLCVLMGDMAKVSNEDILSPSRKWPLPAIRGILYIYYREQGFCTPHIGKMFNRDHATVLAGIKRTRGWIESREPFVFNLYNRFQEVIQTKPLNTESENK